MNFRKLLLFCCLSSFHLPIIADISGSDNSNRQLLSDLMMASGVIGAIIGSAGLGLGLGISLDGSLNPNCKDRFVLAAIRNLALKSAIPITIISGGLFAFGKKLDARKYVWKL